MKTAYAGFLMAAVLVTRTAIPAQTEFHLQYGKLKNPFSAAQDRTFVFTMQQASGWKLGDSFFFLDYLNDGGEDGFNERDFYAEWYPTLSLGKLSNEQLSLGPVGDFSIIGGVNVGGAAKVLKYLPGLRFSWDIPGFLFLNTDLTAYMDDNIGLEGGGAPKADNSFMIDVNWALPFVIGDQSLAVAGHAEYLGGRTNELNEDLKGSVLAQPQITWDLGRAVAGVPHQFMVGVEYQYWLNKLGTDQDESTVQLLLVWRL